jgi:hypothetical protein
MKTLMVCALLIVSAGAFAQSHSISGSMPTAVYIVHPRVIVGAYSPFYSPFGYYGYPWGYPGIGFGPYGPYPMGYHATSPLEKKEAEIRADYKDRIYSVKQDSSLNSTEKRQEIRDLKKQRKQDIRDLVANYHRNPLPEAGKQNGLESAQ